MSAEMSKTKFRKVISKEKLEGRLKARETTLRRMTERANAQHATVRISGVHTNYETQLLYYWSEVRSLLSKLKELEMCYAEAARVVRDFEEAYQLRQANHE